MPRASRRRTIGALLLGVGGLVGAGLGGPAGAEPVPEPFEFSDGPQEFVVPAEVCQVTIEAFGAEGGGVEPADGAGLGGHATRDDHRHARRDPPGERRRRRWRRSRRRGTCRRWRCQRRRRRRVPRWRWGVQRRRGRRRVRRPPGRDRAVHRVVVAGGGGGAAAGSGEVGDSGGGGGATKARTVPRAAVVPSPASEEPRPAAALRGPVTRRLVLVCPGSAEPAAPLLPPARASVAEVAVAGCSAVAAALAEARPPALAAVVAARASGPRRRVRDRCARRRRVRDDHLRPGSRHRRLTWQPPSGTGAAPAPAVSAAPRFTG